MSSGVTTSEEAKTVYAQLQRGLKVDGIKLNFVTFKLAPGFATIEVDQKGSKDYETFVSEELPEDGCRWAVYDFEYDLGDAGKRQKIVLISWAPDLANRKERMVFASSTDAIRRELTGIQLQLQATDLDEVTRETIQGRLAKP